MRGNKSLCSFNSNYSYLSNRKRLRSSILRWSIEFDADGSVLYDSIVNSKNPFKVSHWWTLRKLINSKRMSLYCQSSMNVNGMVLFRKSVSTFYSFLFLNSFQFSKWVKAIVAIDARINGLWSNRTHSLGAPFRGVGPTCGHDFENGARVYRTQYGTRRDLPTRQFWRETEELHMKFFMKCKQNRHDWWNKYICLNRLPSSRKNWIFFYFRSTQLFWFTYWR